MRIFKLLLPALFAWNLCACGSSKSDTADLKWSQMGVTPATPRTLGVNAYLWQAAREIFSFLPVVKADPFGGVIISDWYLPTPNERMKVTVYIMDRALRADGLKVRVFRQVRNATEWQYADANPEIGRKLEDAILTRARQLRLTEGKAAKVGY